MSPEFPSLSKQKRYWDHRWHETLDVNSWSRRSGESILMLLRSVPLAHPKILDAGCGTGWLTEHLSDLGQVTGVDLSERAIALAKSRLPFGKFIAGNLFDIPLPAGDFDVVVCQQVIAHVPNQAALLDRLAYLLKPNGYLVITTANKFVIERTPLPPDPPEHIKQWLDGKGLKRLLRRHFRILHTTTVVPMGNQGILRLVNSPKLNATLGLVIPQHYLDLLKERAGFGYTRIALAQRQSY